jgi:hypothetical protein
VQEFQTTSVLAPLCPTPTSFDTTLTLTILHLELNNFLFLFLEDYELDQDLKLSSYSFKLAFQFSTHVKFIYKWYFWDGLWTPLRVLSPKKLHEWIPIVVSIFLSYHTRSHSMLNCTYPWGCSLLGHDQTFRWSLSHCHNGNVVSIRKPHFMLSILWCVCNTFFPIPI